MGPASLQTARRIAPLRNRRQSSVLVGCDLCTTVVRVPAIGLSEPDLQALAEDATWYRQAVAAAPWTDTKPRPNWLSLGLSSALLLLAGIFFYSYLLSSLIELLKA